MLVTAEFLRLCLRTTGWVPPLLVDKRLTWKESLSLQNQVCCAQTLPGGTAKRQTSMLQHTAAIRGAALAVIS